MRSGMRLLRVVGFLGLCAIAAIAAAPVVAQPAPDVIHEPYQLDTGLVSRSISFENPTGAPGEGGKAASHLGVGRKGAASRNIQPGETVQLCDIEGPGTIRHIWVTIAHDGDQLRSTVLTAWWDGQEHPSIQCPVGDFFGAAHGKIKPYCSAVHSFGNRAGMNIWLPMPFQKRARFAFTTNRANRCRSTTRLRTRSTTSTRPTWDGCTCCSAARIRPR